MLVPSLLERKRDWEADGLRLTGIMGVIEAMKSLSTGVPMGGVMRLVSVGAVGMRGTCWMPLLGAGHATYVE
jgi:hypothetical protein